MAQQGKIGYLPIIVLVFSVLFIVSSFRTSDKDKSKSFNEGYLSSPSRSAILVASDKDSLKALSNAAVVGDEYGVRNPNGSG